MIVPICTAAMALAMPSPAQQHFERLAQGLLAQGGCERVEVLVHRDGQGDPARSEIAWCVQPAGDDRTLWLALGDLRVWMAGGRTIAHRGGEAYWEGSYDLPLDAGDLRRTLPPIAAPALDLALGDRLDAFEWLVVTPRAGEIEHLVGRRGDDLLGIESLNGRVVRTVLRHEPPRGDEGAGWTIETRRLGDAVAEPAPEVAGMERVGSLTALPGASGDALAALGLNPLDGRPWSLEAALVEGGGRVVLALVPADDARAALVAGEALRLVRERAPAAPTTALAGVFDLGAFDAAALAALERRWGAPAGESRLLWSVAGHGAIERLAPGQGPPALLVVDASGVVGAFGLAGGADPAALAERVLEGWPGGAE